MPLHKAACVIGWPVGHSRSPLIHNYWIKQHGLDAEYRREAVALELPRELDWALEEVKEQMLIRRDVKKDETVPEQAQFVVPAVDAFTMSAVQDEPITELMIPVAAWSDGSPAPKEGQ